MKEPLISRGKVGRRGRFDDDRRDFKFRASLASS